MPSGRNEPGVPGKDTRFGIPFLDLYGRPREMGAQYGKLLKKELAGALARIDGIKRALLSLFPFFIRPFASVYFSFRTFRAERKIPRDFIDELRGVAEGSGLPYRKVLFASAIAETLIGFGCTSILSLNKGRLLHSRNLDFFPPFLGDIPAVVNYHPEGKNPYTLVGFTGYLPGLTGMNAKGVTISLNESSCAVNKNVKHGTLAGYVLRRVLEEANGLKDADRIVQGQKYTQGWTLTVGSSREKNGVIYDITGDAVFRNSLRPKHSIYAVNTFVNGRVMNDTQCVTRAGHPINHLRKTLLDRAVPFIRDAASAIKTLSDISVPGFGDIVGDSTVNNYRTLQTVVLDAQRQRIVFSSAPAYAGLAAFYSYDKFSRKVGLFLRESPFLKRKDTVAFIRWMERLYESPAEGAKSALDAKFITPFHLEAVLFLKELPGVRVPWDRFLLRVTELLERYPGHAQLTRWKGEALFNLKRYGPAADILGPLLKDPLLSPNDRLFAHCLLAECYRELALKKESSRHASAALKILKRYAAGPAENKLAARLKTIVISVKMA